MMDDFENAKVTVEKVKLLDTLRKNRAAHATEYEQACAGYRKATLDELHKMIADVEAGKQIRDSTGLKAPVSHVKDYDIAIDMLEWSKADEIVISSSQFRQFVRDEWDWMRAFKSETSRYIG